MADSQTDAWFSILEEQDDLFSSDKDDRDDRDDRDDKDDKDDMITEDEKKECQHLTRITEAGTMLCFDCGFAITQVISYDKDWRYYGSDDTRKNSDPNRCHIRKVEDKSIFKDVESYRFPEKIVNTANDIYTQVTNGKIYRGKSRKAIIFGCIYQSIKINGKAHTCESLRVLFGLDRKSILKGLKYVNLKAPKTMQHMRSRLPQTNELLEEYMSKFDLRYEHRGTLLTLAERIKNRSTMINRSRPQSIASALIYYYLCATRGSNNVNMADFIDKVGLSELTILKIYREIERVLARPIPSSSPPATVKDEDEEDEQDEEEEEQDEEEEDEQDENEQNQS